MRHELIAHYRKKKEEVIYQQFQEGLSNCMYHVLGLKTPTCYLLQKSMLLCLFHSLSWPHYLSFFDYTYARDMKKLQKWVAHWVGIYIYKPTISPILTKVKILFPRAHILFNIYEFLFLGPRHMETILYSN